MAQTRAFPKTADPRKRPAMTRAADSRRERKAIVALFAVFALLVQALIPVAAMAAPRLVAGDIICAGGRVHTAANPAAPASHKAMAGMPCQDCLAAALAVVTTPPLDFARVAYQTGRVEHVAAAVTIAPRARAPPRPPGQGPPAA
jgi:hypothetical protein